MVYATVIYIVGLAAMSFGFLMSPEIEKRDVRLLPTILAYALWPISFFAVIANVVWEKVGHSFAVHHPGGRIVHH